MLSVNKKLEMDTVNKHKTALNRDYDKRSVEVNGIAALARKYLAQQNHDKLPITKEPFIRRF